MSRKVKFFDQFKFDIVGGDINYLQGQIESVRAAKYISENYDTLGMDTRVSVFEGGNRRDWEYYDSDKQPKLVRRLLPALELMSSQTYKVYRGMKLPAFLDERKDCKNNSFTTYLDTRASVTFDKYSSDPTHLTTVLQIGTLWLVVKGNLADISDSMSPEKIGGYLPPVSVSKMVWTQDYSKNWSVIMYRTIRRKSAKAIQ